MNFRNFSNKIKLIILVFIFVIIIKFRTELNKVQIFSYKFYFNAKNNCTKTKLIFCDHYLSKPVSLSIFNIIKKPLNSYFIKSHPNLPVILYESENLPNVVPHIQNIRWSGIHWQESKKGNSKFLLYSAHLDRHKCNNGFNRSLVYVLGLYEGYKKPGNYLCQFFVYETYSSFVLPVDRYDLIDYQGFSSERLVPYLLSCHLPFNDSNQIPDAVSLVNDACEIPTNLLQITGTGSRINETINRDTKYPTVGVCSPALYYYHEDFSSRLVEWIEILNLIGVSKIIFYKTTVHPNIEKVLNYYQGKNRIKIISFHYPPPYLDEPELRRLWTQTKRKELFALENIYFTDCIQRFKNEFDYLAHFDPDEMPILKKHQTIGELIMYLKNLSIGQLPSASFGLKWKVFYQDLSQSNYTAKIPESFYMLRHPNRISKIIDPVDFDIKSIYDTNQVRAAFSHEPILYIKGNKGKSLVVDSDIAYTAHFRSSDCGEKCKDVQLVEEEFFKNITNVVMQSVNTELSQIGIT